ncbi:MAG TPA: DUF2442 domain-containing protein [Thermoanaerobaculia bacterium]
MTISEVEVVPLAIGLETSEDELTVSLADGRRLSVPLAWFPRLLNATSEQRAAFRLIGGGEGIHWPGVDEDISVAGLLRGSSPRTAGLRALADQVPLSEVEYRRSEHGSTWHWCTTCSTYPSRDYFTRSSPPNGELCNECLRKSENRRCGPTTSTT